MAYVDIATLTTVSFIDRFMHFLHKSEQKTCKQLTKYENFTQTFAPVYSNRFHALQQQILVYRVDVLFFLGENEHRRGSFLQAFEEIDNFGLLLDVLDFLHDVHGRGARPADVYRYGLHEGGARKVLDLFWHSGGKEKSLSLTLGKMVY